MSLPHIVKAFDRELEALTTNIGAMGEFARSQFNDAVQALLHHDAALAARIVEQDQRLDAQRRDLSASAAMVITRRQPLASDLDEVLSDFQAIEEIERIGDLAKNIAKRAIATSATGFPQELVATMTRLAGLASDQVGRALAAFATRNAAQAQEVRQGDEALDELHTALFRDILARMDTDHAHVVGFVHLLFCAKNIERVGDHATHIAEAAYLKATGRRPETERRKRDESSLVSDTKPADSQTPP